MGVKLTRIDELDDYRHQINQIGKLHVERLTVPWLAVDWIYSWFGKAKTEHKYVKEAHDFTGGIIDRKRKQFQLAKGERISSSVTTGSMKKERYAMLDTLLHAEENGNQIDATGIQEEVDTFVFEGFDTTMTAITFILFMIATHSDVQKRLYEEIQSLGDTIDYNNLKYLDAVIKETLRLYPSVPFIGRILGEETEIGMDILLNESVPLSSSDTRYLRLMRRFR